MEQERIDAAIRHSEELEKERKGQEMARLRSKLKSKLPKEPKEEKEEGKPVSKLRFRVPAATHGEDSDDELDNKNSDRPNGIVSGSSNFSNNQIVDHTKKIFYLNYQLQIQVSDCQISATPGIYLKHLLKRSSLLVVLKW